MTNFGGRAVIFGAMVSVLAVSACGQRERQENPVESMSAQQIFLQAEATLENPKDADEAAELFGEVERLYPYSEWAKRALIMQAYAFYVDKDYENSRATAQRFVDFYPADDDAAYAAYIIALSYYDQIELVGRDQGLTFQALQALRTVIERYPDSEYAQSSVLKFDLAFDHLAAKEMEVGRYYLKRGHFASSVNRFRTVVEDFETTSHTPEALYRLIEAYLSLGLTDEAQTAGAILGYNFQSSEWYQDAYDLLQGRGLKPEPRGRGWLKDIHRQMIKGHWL